MNDIAVLLAQGTVEIYSKEQLQELLTRTLWSLNGGAVEDASQLAVEIIRDATKYISGDYEFKHINVWQHPEIEDMMIAILMSTGEDTEPYDILSEDGVFGYVYNVDAPYCSELGYSFYKKEHDIALIVRVG